MIQNKKVRTYHTKRAVEHAQSSAMKPPYLKFSFLSRFVPKNKKAAVKMLISVVVIVAIAGSIPFPYAFAKTVTLPPTTTNQKTAELELGDTKVLREGSNGSKTVEVKSLQSIWGRLFGLQPLQQKEGTSTIIRASVNKIVANGTIKYQYMLCSDGGSRYYTDEQFKDEKVGFTSKSQDDCASNNKGHKVSLTNSNPANGVAVSNNSSTGGSSGSPQADTYAADKINREVEKLRWCSEQDEIISNEYIGKVHQAQATQGITDKEFNAIVDPAYFKYSGNVGLLKASGCTITVVFPNYIRQ